MKIYIGDQMIEWKPEKVPAMLIIKEDAEHDLVEVEQVDNRIRLFNKTTPLKDLDAYCRKHYVGALPWLKEGGKDE